MNNKEWVYNIVKDCFNSGFTGYLQINFFKGGVSNINQNKSIKPQPENLEGVNELLSKEVQG